MDGEASLSGNIPSKSYDTQTGGSIGPPKKKDAAEVEHSTVNIPPKVNGDHVADHVGADDRTDKLLKENLPNVVGNKGKPPPPTSPRPPVSTNHQVMPLQAKSPSVKELATLFGKTVPKPSKPPQPAGSRPKPPAPGASQAASFPLLGSSAGIKLPQLLSPSSQASSSPQTSPSPQTADSVMPRSPSYAPPRIIPRKPSTASPPPLPTSSAPQAKETTVPPPIAPAAPPPAKEAPPAERVKIGGKLAASMEDEPIRPMSFVIDEIIERGSFKGEDIAELNHLIGKGFVDREALNELSPELHEKVFAELDDEAREILGKADMSDVAFAEMAEVADAYVGAPGLHDFDKQEDYLTSRTGQASIRHKVNNRRKDFSKYNAQMGPLKKELAALQRAASLPDGHKDKSLSLAQIKEKEGSLKAQIHTLEMLKLHSADKLNKMLRAVKQDNPERYMALLADEDLGNKIKALLDSVDVFQLPEFGKTEVPKHKQIQSAEKSAEPKKTAGPETEKTEDVVLEKTEASKSQKVSAVKKAFRSFIDFLSGMGAKTSLRHKVEKRLSKINNLTNLQKILFSSSISGESDAERTNKEKAILKHESQKLVELQKLCQLLDQVKKDDPVKFEKMFYDNKLRFQVIEARENVLGREACEAPVKKLVEDLSTQLKKQLESEPNRKAKTYQDHLNNLYSLYDKMRGDPALWGSRLSPGFKLIEDQIASTIKDMEKEKIYVDSSRAPKFVKISKAEISHMHQMRGKLTDSLMYLKSKVILPDGRMKNIGPEVVDPNLEIEELSALDYFLLQGEIQKDIHDMETDRAVGTISLAQDAAAGAHFGFDKVVEPQKDIIKNQFKESYAQIEREFAELPAILEDNDLIEKAFAELPSHLKIEGLSVEDKAKVLRENVKNKLNVLLEKYAFQLQSLERSEVYQSLAYCQKQLLERMASPLVIPSSSLHEVSEPLLPDESRPIETQSVKEKLKEKLGVKEKQITSQILPDGTTVKPNETTVKKVLGSGLQNKTLDAYQKKVNVNPSLLNIIFGHKFNKDTHREEVSDAPVEEDLAPKENLAPNLRVKKELQKKYDLAEQQAAPLMKGLDYLKVVLLDAPKEQWDEMLAEVPVQEKIKLTLPSNVGFMRLLLKTNPEAHDRLLENIRSDVLGVDVQKAEQVVSGALTEHEKSRRNIDAAIAKLENREEFNLQDREALLGDEAATKLGVFWKKMDTNAEAYKGFEEWLSSQFPLSGDDELGNAVILTKIYETATSRVPSAEVPS